MSCRRSGSSRVEASVRVFWGARLAALAALCVGTPGCMNPADRASAFFFPATANTFERAGEEVTLTATYASKDPLVESGTEGLVAHAGPGIAMAAAFLADRVAAFLETESERYSATYSATLVDDKFYASSKAATSVNLTGLALTRHVDDSDGKPTEAMRLEFAINGSRDGTAFTLKPAAVKVTKAKAKLPAFALFDVPSWFSAADRDLDMKVQVDIHAAWIDRLGNPRYERIVSQEFKVSNLELGEQKSLKVPMVLSPGIPRSSLGELSGAPAFGLGNFAVTVLVKEYDDYGKRVAEVAKQVGERADALED